MGALEQVSRAMDTMGDVDVEDTMVVLTGNVLAVLLVAFSWGWECLVVRNKFRRGSLRPREFWLVPLAAWAYWAYRSIMRSGQGRSCTYRS